MEERLGRSLPQAPEAEQAVLGSCIIEPRCLTELLPELKSENFYSAENREIYEALAAMFTTGKKIDPITVIDELKQRGAYKEGRTEDYIRGIVMITPTAANAMKYAHIVRDQALLRDVIDACTRASEQAYAGGDANEVLDYAEREIYALRQGRVVGGLIPASQIVQTVYANLTDLAENGKEVPGISTGFGDVDRKILGLNNSDFVLIAARPGMGKTAIALNMAMNAAKTSNKTVAIFSLEMSQEQLVQRLLAAEGEVSLKHLLTGNMTDEDWRRTVQACGILSQIDIRVNDNPSLTVADMNAQCRRLPNLGLVVIDYLQLMQSAGSGHTWSNESRVQAVSDISRMLKIMAKELNVPVLCLSQLSRANEQRTDKRPMLSDLRESGSIEQDADIVIGLYRDGYYNEASESPNLTEVIVLKNRHGETGKEYLMWKGEFTQFTGAAFKARDEDD